MYRDTLTEKNIKLSICEDQFEHLCNIKNDFIALMKKVKEVSQANEIDFCSFVIQAEQELDDILNPELRRLQEILGMHYDIPETQEYKTWRKSLTKRAANRLGIPLGEVLKEIGA